MSIPWRRTRPVVAVLLAVLVSVALTVLAASSDEVSLGLSLLPLVVAPPVVCALFLFPPPWGSLLLTVGVSWMVNVVVVCWFLYQVAGQGT